MNCYECLGWKININIALNPERTSVTLQYIFINQSNGPFYFSLLPSFQCVPLGNLRSTWITLEASLFDDHDIKKTELFSICDEVYGIREGNQCFHPLPWNPSGGAIPPKNILKIDINWVENGPKIDNMGESQQEWRVDYCLPMQKLFLPMELEGKSPDQYAVLPPEIITWKIFYPAGVHVNGASFDKSFSPSYNVKPYINNRQGPNNSIIEFNVEPTSPKIKGRSFSDHLFTLVSQLSVPLDLAKEVFSNAEKKVRDHTKSVCVAAIDLRGSSKMADIQKDLPDPTLFTSNFHERTISRFPHSLYREQPLFLLMKKVVGDMLILIAPAKKTNDLFREVVNFTTELLDDGFEFRAGFHVDQATDTGKFLSSYTDFGTDFLGPAINYGVKVGDDKQNEGVRITEPVLELIDDSIKSVFNIDSIEPIDARQDLKIFQMTPKAPESIVTTKSLEPFSDRLIDRIIDKNTRICVGLDPDLSRFPKKLLEGYEISTSAKTKRTNTYHTNISKCILEFNKRVIDSVCEYAAAIKPQSAHYERYGYHGIKALRDTAIYAKQKGLLVILDAKRNDIGKTAKKYAMAYLGPDSGETCASIPFDAITVNPYLGIDGVQPFLEVCAENKKGIFILVKTSNPSSADFQDLIVNGEKETLAEHVAKRVQEWGGDSVGKHSYSSIGAVVGATHPENIKLLREIMPSVIFLMPGYGAQGATAKDIINSFDDKGFGAIISSSSAINYAFPPEADEFERYIREKAEEMRDDINSIIKNS